MEYDLVIRNGTVVDGSGLARYRADVGISGDRIACIGRIDGKGKAEIDAEGHVVTPGFIDGHTHMDAQIFWNPLGTNSSWHGVTSVVMGNCGFTLAPSRPKEHGLLMDNLARAEDIPAESMDAGIEWSWESFPEYLDAIDKLPKAINYATQIGHSALRTFAMGERAFSELATDEELKTMEVALREALRAGALGFSTSTHPAHLTPTGRPVASRIASWGEITRLCEVIGEEGDGIFQIAVNGDLASSDDLEIAQKVYDDVRELAINTRVPVTFGIRPEHVQMQLDTFDATAAGGGRMFGQSRSNLLASIYCFKTRMPYDNLEGWKELRAAPLEERRVLLHDSDFRKRLVHAVEDAYAQPHPATVRGYPNPSVPAFEILRVMRPSLPDVSVAELARERGVSPVELILDLALESDFEQTFSRFLTPEQAEDLLTSMKHPRSIMTFSDSGAHVSRIVADLQVTLLSEWVRDRREFTLEEAVRMITLAPALAWQIPERGLLSEGMIADLNVFDPETVAPGVPFVANDLPAGAPRILQQAIGIRSTIVAGKEIMHEGEHTGALPGRLLRAAGR